MSEVAMSAKIRRWLKQEGLVFFKDIGVQPGNRVLDFGCGKGNYAIPAARVVRDNGLVYALDKDRFVLRNLMDKASSLGIFNIVPVHDLEELRRSLRNELLDVVLFYDVIHSYYFSSDERERLLTSISTVVKQNGLISIFPNHMDRNEISAVVDTLVPLGFSLEKEKSTSLIHDDTYEVGYMMNFRKQFG
jgi:ubiquinone/menaquinone biosynthesis C-methylase UbiE